MSTESSRTGRNHNQADSWCTELAGSERGRLAL